MREERAISHIFACHALEVEGRLHQAPSKGGLPTFAPPSKHLNRHSMIHMESRENTLVAVIRVGNVMALLLALWVAPMPRARTQATLQAFAHSRQPDVPLKKLLSPCTADRLITGRQGSPRRGDASAWVLAATLVGAMTAIDPCIAAPGSPHSIHLNMCLCG